MKRILLAFSMVCCWFLGFGQTAYTFTTGGATGQFGPSQAQITTAYTGTTLAGQVTVSAGIQKWVVPQTGVYRIVASGALGGDATSGPAPGKGATIAGDFLLQAGDTIRILVGQKGVDRNFSAGGGGGTFVTMAPYNTLSSILVIAGGGGASSGDFAGIDAPGDSCSTFDVQSGPGNCIGNGGISFTGNSGGGGGGFFTAGQNGGIGNGGQSYILGGAGGSSTSTAIGGFGGGGGQNGTGTYAASGGGGFSGGNGGNRGSTSGTGRMGGGGGSSWNSGLNQINIGGDNSADGLVVITLLSSNPCSAPLTVTNTVVACDSVLVNWTGATDSAIVSYVTTGGTPTTGTLVIGDSAFTITGTSAMTTYDVYVANICGGDTAVGGPYTFSTGNMGAPMASFSANLVTSSLSVSFDGSGSTGNGNTYAWDFGDGNTGSGVNPTHLYASGGTKSIKLTVTNACGTDDTTITVANISLGENTLSANMIMFPNPVSDALNIELNSAESDYINITIMDISGKTIMSLREKRTSSKYEGRIDVSTLSKGIYMIEVTDGSYTALRRLIIE